MGKPRKVDSPKKKKVEKPQGGRQKLCQNIRNSYHMEDNKNPKGAARSAAPLGRRRSRRLVVTHLVRISYAFAPFSEPVLALGIIFSPAGRGKFYNPGCGLFCLPAGRFFVDFGPWALEQSD